MMRKGTFIKKLVLFVSITFNIMWFNPYFGQCYFEFNDSLNISMNLDYPEEWKIGEDYVLRIYFKGGNINGQKISYSSIKEKKINKKSFQSKEFKKSFSENLKISNASLLVASKLDDLNKSECLIIKNKGTYFVIFFFGSSIYDSFSCFREYGDDELVNLINEFLFVFPETTPNQN
jgi:hypothetical protein